MSVIINGMNMPTECKGCKFENRYGGCLLINAIGIDASCAEFDDEWHSARDDHRRLKWCPLQDTQQKHGVWKKYDDIFFCSECNRGHPHISPCCPYCGTPLDWERK